MKVFFLIFSFFLSSFSVNASDWIYSLDQGRAVSLSENKLILVDFWASWCGPCKAMDREVWNKEEVNTLQDNYVSVKIDIDANKSLALQYGVRSIPAILLIDGLGNVVYQSSGYKDKFYIEKLLGSFSGDIKQLNQVIGLYIGHEKDAMRNLMLAKGYQKYIGKSENQIKGGFISKSSTYFKKAKKIAKKAGDKDLVHSIELSSIYNNIILDRPKKAIDAVVKMIEKEKLTEKNLALAYFTIIKGLELNNNKVEKLLYLKKLKELPNTEKYLKRIIPSDEP